jgi:parallel beta-helix repeat protein
VTVEDNPISGIQISRGGGAAITNSLIQLNGGDGIRLDEGANARIGVDILSDPGGNIIKENSRNGIALNRSSTARIENNTVEDNGNIGVAIWHGSSAQITGNIIQGNNSFEIIVTDGSTAQLTNNTVTDDSSSSSTGTVLGVFRSSNVRLLGGNTLLQENNAPRAIALSAFHVVQVRQSGSGNDVIDGPRAVEMGNFTTFDLRGSNYTLNGDVRVFEFGAFRVRGTGTINGNIFATSPLSTARERSGSAISLTGSCFGDNCSIVPD